MLNIIYRLKFSMFPSLFFLNSASVFAQPQITHPTIGRKGRQMKCQLWFLLPAATDPDVFVSRERVAVVTEKRQTAYCLCLGECPGG